MFVECDDCGRGYEVETDDEEYEEGIGHICDACWEGRDGDDDEEHF